MKLYCNILLLFFTSLLSAQDFIPLWPEGKMPNSKGLKVTHQEERQRITQVAIPGMYAFFPSNEENQGIAVLICPPGGYHHLTYVWGGFQFAKWLNTLGISAFVLIYRLPNSPDLIVREKGPVQDAQRAMRIIRANAEKWSIDPEKAGIMGASAGGHLASVLGTHTEDFSKAGDAGDAFSFVPDFMILVSPVITMGPHTHDGSRDNFLGKQPSEAKIKKYSNELHVSPKTPPTFIVHAQDDNAVAPQNSLLFYTALTRHQVPASLHLFPQGKHTIALRNNPGSANYWTMLCEAWLREMNFLSRR